MIGEYGLIQDGMKWIHRGHVHITLLARVDRDQRDLHHRRRVARLIREGKSIPQGRGSIGRILRRIHDLHTIHIEAIGSTTHR